MYTSIRNFYSCISLKNTTTEKAILTKKPIYCANATIRFHYGVVHTYFSVYSVLRFAKRQSKRFMFGRANGMLSHRLPMFQSWCLFHDGNHTSHTDKPIKPLDEGVNLVKESCFISEFSVINKIVHCRKRSIKLSSFFVRNWRLQ